MVINMNIEMKCYNCKYYQPFFNCDSGKCYQLKNNLILVQKESLIFPNTDIEFIMVEKNFFCANFKTNVL